MKINKENMNGFEKGWNEAKQQLADSKGELMKILGVKTDASFLLYKNGKANLGYAKRVLVKQAFEKYGIADPFDGDE